MISPELYVQESEKIREVLEQSNEYLERIVETLVSSLDFTKESERQAAIRAENAELATIEAIREARGSDLQAGVNIDGAAEEAGTSLGRSLSDRFRGSDFTNRFRTGLSAGLAGLGARLLRGGPLAAIGVAFGEEIAKFLSDNVGDMLEDVGFADSTVTAVEDGLKKYTPAAVIGAGIGMILKRTPQGALAGIILERLGLRQEDFVNTANMIATEIDELFDFELPTIEDIGGFLQQGASGAGIGMIGGMLLGTYKVPLVIAGFLADYLGLNTESLKLFAEQTAQEVDNLLQEAAEPAVETTSVVDVPALNERLGMAATGLSLPSNVNVPMPALEQFYATPLYNDQGEVTGRLSDRLGLSGTFDTSIPPEAFTAAIELRSSFGQGIDIENLKTLTYGQLDNIMGELESNIDSVDKFLDLDPEIQKRFVTNETVLTNLRLVRELAQEKYDVIADERGELRPQVYTGDLIKDFLTNMMIPGTSDRPADQPTRDAYEQQLTEDSNRLRRSIQQRQAQRRQAKAEREERKAAREARRLNIPFTFQNRGVEPLPAYPEQVESGGPGTIIRSNQDQTVEPIEVNPTLGQADSRAESFQVNPVFGPVDSGIESFQINPMLNQNEISQISKSIATTSSSTMVQPVVNNFNNVDASTNVSGGGGGGTPAQLPAGASKSYDRSEQLYA